LMMNVLAALAVISWTAPTHNTDGSVLTNLESHVVYCATTFAAIESSPRGEVMMPEQSFTLPDLSAGTWLCAAKARTSADVYSALSQTVTVVVEAPPPPPPPPSGVVTVMSTVMELRVGKNGPWLVRKVGTVPLGVSCIGDPLMVVTGADWYAVPRSAVTFTKSVSTSAKIVARCN